MYQDPILYLEVGSKVFCFNIFSFPHIFQQLSRKSFLLFSDLYMNRHINGLVIFIYKITNIIHMLWLAKRRVCMRVCKHSWDVKMFSCTCQSCKKEYKKGFELKTQQVCFFTYFFLWLKLAKSLETCCVNFLHLHWYLKARKIYILESTFLQSKNWLC